MIWLVGRSRLLSRFLLLYRTSLFCELLIDQLRAVMMDIGDYIALAVVTAFLHFI